MIALRLSRNFVRVCTRRFQFCELHQVSSRYQSSIISRSPTFCWLTNSIAQRGYTLSLEDRISCFRCYSSSEKDSTGGSVLPVKLEAKKYIEYTCKVCNTRNSHTFSKLSYEKGIVIVTCQGCDNRHLIADNLGWFQYSSRNIEEMLAEKGEHVKVTSDGGTQEIVPDDNTGSKENATRDKD